MSVVLDAVRPYRRLFADPALRGLAVADACARLPQGMVSITLLMVTAVHASMTVAGLAVAGYALGQGITGPPRGRLADRYGLVRVTAVCGCGYALALAGLLIAALAGAPAGALIAAAGTAGLIVPPLSPGMRGLWSVHAAGGLRRAAFAFDAVVFDLAAIVGPALASALAVGISPATALIVLLAFTGAAIMILATRRRAGERRSGERRSGGPGPAPARQPVLTLLASGRFRRLLVTGAFVNIALSGTEVALTAYVRQQHALWAAGPLLGGISVGSIAGSLILGARAPSAVTSADPEAPAEPGMPGERGASAEAGRPGTGRATGNRFFRLVACYAVGLAGLTAASLDAPLLAVAAPLAGFCLGSVLATLFSQAGSAAPPGSDTEAQGWLNSVMNGGASAGAAIAGLASGTPVLALGLAAAAAAIAAVATAAGRDRRHRDRQRAGRRA